MIFIDIWFPLALIYTLPLFLAKSDSPAEFVLNAMALIFIVTLDDIPEGKRNAYAISLAEDLDTNDPETLDPESTPTEDTVLPWGHVVTREAEIGSPTSVQSAREHTNQDTAPPLPPQNPATDLESG